MRLPRPVPAIVAAVAGVVLLVAGPADAGPATTDPLAAHQWALDRIGAERAWTRGTGAGIVVAVVDTGVDLGHEDLAPKLVPGRDLVDGDDSPTDCVGHGTLVAGIVGAATDNRRGVAGTAPGASIMPVRVLTCNGRSPTGRDTVSEGIRWAVDHGAHVVNLSLGSELDPLLGPGFADAIEYAWSKGVICVVATGNEFVTGSGFDDEPAVVVTATERDDDRATYASTVGGARWGLAAPGGAASSGSEDERLREDVLSTWWSEDGGSGYATAAGTSMAAPHVSGALAILRGLGLGPEDAVQRVLATADDLGSPGVDSAFGHGRLNVDRATSGLGPAPGPPPSTTAPPPSPTTAPGTTPPTTATTSAAPAPGSTASTEPPPTTTTASPAAPTTATSEPGARAGVPGGAGDDIPIAAAPPPPGGGGDEPSRAVPAAMAAGAALGAAVAAGAAARSVRRRAPAGRGGR